MLSPVGCTLSVCGCAVAEISSSVSAVDSVVKLKDTTTLAGSRPIPCAIMRCAPVSWHTAFSVGSVMLGQVAPPASAVLMLL